MNRPARVATARWTSTAKRTNQTHVSPSDPEAKLYRKAKVQPAKHYYMGHLLMEQRHGLPVDSEVSEANGFAERDTALTMLDRLPRRQRRTLAADKVSEVAEFMADCRERRLTRHVASSDGRPGAFALDRRMIRQGWYRWSQRLRKRIEEGFR